tara:strand:+ start:5675 stop:8473 length:2799 start_codon:yes stop_codon:yes gene_type:complete
MAENFKDPCEEIVRPSNEPGDAVEPTPQEFDFDPPLFPELETEFEGEPSSRSCIIVPRHLYYNQYNLDSGLLGRRDPDDAINPMLTSNSPLPSAEQDIFRFIMGKVYDVRKYRNSNYFTNTGFSIDDTKKVDFKLSINSTVQRAPDTGNVLSRKHSMTLISTPKTASLVFYKENHPLSPDVDVKQYGTIVDFYKRMVTQAERKAYIDNSFKAPAAFFAKESDGLNIRLPETVSIQTFIPNMLTFSDTQADYNNLYETSNEDPRLTTSLYQKYSAEYNERLDPCGDGGFVKVQKFPAREVQLINQITKSATPDTSSGELTSFQRIFESNYKFYNKISFDMKRASPIAAKLKELMLDALFLGIIDTESPSKPELYTQFIDERIQSFVGLADNDGVSKDTRPNSYKSLFEKFDTYINPDDPETQRDRLPIALDPSTYPLSFVDEELWTQEHLDYDIGGGNLSLFSIIRFGNRSIFLTWLEEYMSRKATSFSALMKGEINHSEIVAYRLEKRDALTEEVLQNFYFFNDPDTESLNFIDTQVNFNSRYIYSIYAINFVVGLEYRYSRIEEEVFDNITIGQKGDVNIKLSVQDKVVPYVIESPYHQQEIYVSDAPPLPPDVTFLPWETLSEELSLFWFTPRLGELRELPISILEEDNEVIQRMKEAQNVGAYTNQEVYYKSDSDPTHYEMFVLEQPPLSYKDFINAHFEEATIAAPTKLVRFQPNKDYYLTFRARDLGGISNPTKVYRFRINSYGDGIQREIEEYTFEQTTSQYLLQFDQMLQVEPTREQRSINFSNSQNYSELEEDLASLLETTRGVQGLSLGLSENVLWGKTFVFEIVSAETGRVFQIRSDWDQEVQNQDAHTDAHDNDPMNETEISGENYYPSSYCSTAERDQIYSQNRDKSDTAASTLTRKSIDRSSDSQSSRGDTGRGPGNYN